MKTVGTWAVSLAYQSTQYLGKRSANSLGAAHYDDSRSSEVGIPKVRAWSTGPYLDLPNQHDPTASKRSNHVQVRVVELQMLRALPPCEMSPTSRLLVSLSHSADMNLLGLGGMTLDTRCTPVPLTLQFPPLVLCKADAESPAISDNSGVGVAYMLLPRIKVYKIMICGISTIIIQPSLNFGRTSIVN